MQNIAILCSGGDNIPKRGELSHVFLDNTETDVKHCKQGRKQI